jgi:hypothetical protein
MPVHVDLADIKGAEGARARKLYAAPAAAAPAAKKPARASFAERSAPARGRMADRKRAARQQTQRTAQRRSGAKKALRGLARHVGRTQRATGNPGGVIAGTLGLFIGAGILVAVVRSPGIITGPLAFIGTAIKAFTGLLNGPRATAPPPQNVAPATKGYSV